MKDKDPRDVIHEVKDLEDYLDRFLASEQVTFAQWVERFGGIFYRTRNEAILAMVKKAKPRNVLEFACAGPFLAQMLVDNVRSIARYTCSNFSTRMVEYCQARLKNYPQCDVALIDADVRRSTDMHRDRIAAYDTFITTSLEHIQFDLDLVNEFPTGSTFILSLARFDDPEHFRVFESAADITSRYGGLLKIKKIDESTDGKKFVALGVRRNTSAGGDQL
jgi:hypothetical protein